MWIISQKLAFGQNYKGKNAGIKRNLPALLQ
jgi:hypothetical protein